MSKDVICSHGDCANSTEWDDSLRQKHHHTNIYNILFRMPQPVAPKHSTVLYVGHIFCEAIGSVCNEYDTFGLDVPNAKASVLATYLETKPEADYTRTLMHEIGHLFNVIDHYREELTAEQKAQGFSDNCLYGDARTSDDVTNNLTICPGCQKIIRENANKYHD